MRDVDRMRVVGLGTNLGIINLDLEFLFAPLDLRWKRERFRGEEYKTGTEEHKTACTTGHTGRGGLASDEASALGAASCAVTLRERGAGGPQPLNIGMAKIVGSRDIGVLDTFSLINEFSR